MAIFSKSGAPIQTDTSIHPGEILKDELEAREIKQKDFAVDIGVPVTQLNEIINGKRIVSSELAILLETALGIDASIWTNLQAEYDLAKARNSEKVASKNESVKMWATIKEYINVNYLRKKIGLGENIDENIQIVKSIFNISDFKDFELSDQKPISQYFRRSLTLNVNEINLFTWINYVKYEAKKELENVSEYNEDTFPQLLEELRKVFLNKNVIDNTKYTLANHGVVFLIKDKLELEGVNVDGVSFWILTNPAVVLTRRHNRLDNFIFTLLHELAHIRFHLNRGETVFLDETDFTNSKIDEGSTENQIEKEADEFASNQLIDITDWNDFKRKNYRFDDETIIKFAHTQKVPPAIVRGRLCREKIVSYKKKTDISYDID